MHRRLAAIALAALATVALAGCLPSPIDVVETTPPAPCSSLMMCTQAPVATIESATVSQSQALPDFDSRTFVMTDATQLARLSDILLSHGVYGDATELGPCAGGRTTVLTWTAQGQSNTVTVDTCSDADLAAEIDALVADWHASGLLQPA